MDYFPLSNRTSTFTVLKGSMIEATRAACMLWQRGSKRENLDRLVRDRFLGPRSAAFYRDTAAVLSRRFDFDCLDRGLMETAQRNWPLHEWRAILLWHMTRNEFLLRDFLVDWLFPARMAEPRPIRTGDLYPHLRTIEERGGIASQPWSETTLNRLASALLKTAVDFHLLKGRDVKEFAGFPLSQRTFLYLLHAVRETEAVPDIIDSRTWRMFFLTPAAVEEALGNFHRQGLLKYDLTEGSKTLILPCGSSLEYVHRTRL